MIFSFSAKFGLFSSLVVDSLFLAKIGFFPSFSVRWLTL